VTPGDGTVWYFAYGSNLAPSTFTGRRGIRPLDAQAGWIDDFSLCFDLPVGPGERGVANVSVCAGSRIWGVAYRITIEDAERLDRTEGVDRGYYRRAPVTVRRIVPAAALDAFTYQSGHGVAGRKPSARYIGIILEGARHHALPAEWIAYLEALELAVDERLAASGS
jgi:hypothetical protein